MTDRTTDRQTQAGVPRSVEDIRRDEAHARFEALGPEQIKLLYQTGNLPQVWHVFAMEWLAAGDKNKKA